MPKINTVMSMFVIHPVRLGGIEAFASELSKQLASIGWNSVLVFAGPPSNEAMRFFSLSNARVEVMERCGSLSWRSFRDTSRLISAIRPKILHLHFMDAWNFYPWLAKLSGVEQVFITDHNSRPINYLAKRPAVWKRLLIRLVYWPVTKIFCVSHFVNRCVNMELGFGENRAHTIYNGVDINRAQFLKGHQMDFRSRYSIPDKSIVVLQVSWLIPEKGIEDLLEAVRIVCEKNHRIHFVIAGDGPCRNNYQKLAEGLGIVKNVSFIGAVKDPLGEGLFGSADILCQVSRWEEAFGLTIIEAMASRKPVIATRVGGIPELVQDGQSGCLVERGDNEAIAKAILLLAENSHLRKSMGQIGYESCCSKFDLSFNVSSLISHYRNYK